MAFNPCTYSATERTKILYQLPVTSKREFPIYVGFVAVRCKETENPFKSFEHKKVMIINLNFVS